MREPACSTQATPRSSPPCSLGVEPSLCEAIATSSCSSACRSPRVSSCTRSTSGAAACQHVESAILVGPRRLRPRPPGLLCRGTPQPLRPQWRPTAPPPACANVRRPSRAFDHAGETAPKTVKLFINNDHLAFDDVEDKKPHHEFELTAKDVGGGTIVLPFVKFQFVTNLTVSEASPARHTSPTAARPQPNCSPTPARHQPYCSPTPARHPPYCSTPRLAQILVAAPS